jgi:quinol monooxygenase YgiN
LLAVTSRLRVKKGREAEFERAALALAESALANEEGCRGFRLTRSKHDPQLYELLERYRDDEALASHSNSEHLRDAMPGLMDCLEGVPVVALFEEIGPRGGERRS